MPHPKYFPNLLFGIIVLSRNQSATTGPVYSVFNNRANFKCCHISHIAVEYTLGLQCSWSLLETISGIDS